jgi:hypothetical protein
MKTYDQAVLKVARGYFHESRAAKDAPYERSINSGMMRMVVFIYDVSWEKLIADIERLAKENATEWGK